MLDSKGLKRYINEKGGCMTGKKWMIVLTDEQFEWVKETAEKTGLKGSDIIREIVDRQMNDNPRQFVASLAATQYKMELQELEQQQRALEAKQEEIRKRIKQEKVAI